jgi:maltose O-acetyltransferase
MIADGRSRNEAQPRSTPEIDPTHNFASRLKRHPHLLLPATVAWLRGWWYRIKFTLLGKRFRAGPYFRVYGTLLVSGPGRVRFGRNCLVISNAIKPVCIRTLTPEASVVLGDHAGLNGTSIQCVRRVDIGSLSNIADAYITDTPAHSLGPTRRMESVEDVQPRPVRIGNNVWVSVGVVILDGVEIGDNSVIGACSLVRQHVDANVFVAGNPLQVIRHIS